MSQYRRYHWTRSHQLCVSVGVMGKPSRDGKHYRERAEECRVVAELLVTIELRKKMLDVAADYERMAEAADKLKDDSADSVNLRTLR